MGSAHVFDVRPVVVFDVLGTLVDQAGSLREQVSEAAGVDSVAAAPIVDTWLALVAEEERAIVAGRRSFAPSHELDEEALHHLADTAVLPREAVDRLTVAAQRLRPWPDTVDGLARLSGDVTVMGLSNASRRTLAGLSSNRGLRWHQVLSGEDASSYKPAAALYEAAIGTTPSGAGSPIMVAAHAWDLRAASAAGMRTAYVPRPGGDEPRADDDFDLYADDLADLHAQLTTGG